MYVDQWGEIHPPPDPEKAKPLNPDSLAALGIEVPEQADIGLIVKRYGTAKARNRQMAAFLVESSTGATNDPYRRLSKQLYDCASWLEFHHYLESKQNRLVKANTCKKHLLCPVCAIRRGAKTLRNYHEKAVFLSDQFDFYSLALTVKNGPDLSERFQHLKSAFKRLRNRGKKGYGTFSRVAGAVWSTEFTKSAEGWHPHLHVIAAVPKGEEPIYYGEGSRLSMDWESVTSDSYIVHAQRIKGSPGDIAAGLCEVLKYAMKFGDLDLGDNLHAYHVLKGKRLIQASGCFFGLELPEDDDLLDDPLDGPYVVLLFKYGASGYRINLGDGGVFRDVAGKVDGVDSTIQVRVAYP